jgi:hypothetical protein
MKNTLTKYFSCPFWRRSDLVALQGTVRVVKKLSFENTFLSSRFGAKKRGV